MQTLPDNSFLPDKLCIAMRHYCCKFRLDIFAFLLNHWGRSILPDIAFVLLVLDNNTLCYMFGNRFRRRNRPGCTLFQRKRLVLLCFSDRNCRPDIVFENLFHSGNSILPDIRLASILCHGSGLSKSTHRCCLDNQSPI